jgi:hypothetical protein
MSAARDLAKLGNTNTLKVDTIRSKVGINSTVPTGDLQVGAAITVGSASGIISATAFYGDGSNLEGVSSAGLGTALADDKAGSVIYYTDTTLGIGSTVNVLVPSGSDVAYTQYAEIAPDENVDVIVAEGDDFLVDVLGLSTAGGAGLSGSGGRIRASYLTNRAGDGAPQLTYGAEVPVGYGITGAGGINVSGALTCGNITGVDATFSGTLTYEDVTNVDATGIITAKSGIEFGTSGVGGTITGAGQAEFTGIVTASSFSGATTDAYTEWVLGASGTDHYTFSGPGLTGAENDPNIYVTRGQKYHFKNSSGGHPFRIQSTANGSSGTAYNDGVTNNDAGDGTTLIWDVQLDTPSTLYYQCTSHADMGGKIYVGNSGKGQVLDGTLVEGFSSTTTAWSSTADLNITNGNIHFCSANLGGTNNTLNIMSTTGINTDLAIGESLTVTGITSVNATSAYVNNLTIDGVATKVWWTGGTTPTAGGGSGIDFYTFTLLKTGSGKFIVGGTQTKTS